MKYLPIVIALLLCLPECLAQEKNYEITVAGMQIGDMKVRRYDSASLTYYKIRSKVSLWLFFRVEVEYNMLSAYRGEQLVSSSSSTHSNKGDFTSSTRWTGKEYMVKIDAYKYKKDTVIREPIIFNAGKLYFQKPPNGQAVYADNFGVLPKAQTKENVMVLEILGNRNTYRYTQGMMTDGKMYHPLKDFRVTLVEGQ